MYSFPMQTDMLALLQYQHRYYASELGRTHQALSKLYRKLARIERTLSEREQRQLSRREKKRLQWAKSVAKSTIEKLDQQQRDLHEYIRQCNELLASYEQPASAVTTEGGWHLPQTPWTAHLPPSPWRSDYGSPFTPYSPVAAHPWTTPATVRASFFPGEVTDRRRPAPQYWDLSMLRERRRSSPNESMADSGFHEPLLYGHPLAVGHESNDDPNHVYAHEIMSASTYSNDSTTERPAEGVERRVSTSSDNDKVPDLPLSPTSPTKMGAEAVGTGHKRRYSENAIQLIESRLAVAKSHQRGRSVGPMPGLERRSVHHPAAHGVEHQVQDSSFGPAVQSE